jgi:hypothetical protein
VIASTAEYIARDAPPAIAPHDRDYLRRYRAPPGDWQIWLGYYIGSEKSLWYEQFRFTLSLKGSSPVSLKKVPNTQVTTIIVGALYLYVFTSFLDGIGSLRLSERLRPIWPLSGADITWPLSVGLSDTDRISLRTRLLMQLKASSHD